MLVMKRLKKQYLLTGLALVALLGGCSTPKPSGSPSRGAGYSSKEKNHDKRGSPSRAPKTGESTSQRQKTMDYIRKEVLKHVGNISGKIPENFVGPIKMESRTLFSQRGYFANSPDSSGWVVLYNSQLSPDVKGSQLIAYYIDNKTAIDFINGKSKAYPKNIIFSVMTTKPLTQKNAVADNAAMAKMIVLERGTHALIYSINLNGRGMERKSLCPLRAGIPASQLFLHMDDMKKSAQFSTKAAFPEMSEIFRLEKDLMATYFKDMK